MTFSETTVRRDTIGQFAQKQGAAAEISLTQSWMDPQARQLLELPTDERDAGYLFRFYEIWVDQAEDGTLRNRSMKQHLCDEWQHPRLPGPSHGPKRYAAGLPWSSEARRLVLSGESLGNKLVFEHIDPVGNTVEELLRSCRSGEVQSAQDMLQKLRDVHTGPRFAVIAKSDDDSITAAGYRTTAPEPGNPLSRYSPVSGGLAGFRVLAEDERYPDAFPRLYKKWLARS